MRIARFCVLLVAMLFMASTVLAGDCERLPVNYTRTVGKVDNIYNLKWLQQGQCVEIIVKTQSRWNATGLLFKQGEQYLIEVQQGGNAATVAPPQDGPNIKTDGNGWCLPETSLDPDCVDSLGDNAGKPQEQASSAGLFISLARGCRRSPSCPWFYLIGVVQNQHTPPHFTLSPPFFHGAQEVPLGNRGVLTVEQDGEFGCFVNDLAGKYANNRGQLLVQIRRKSFEDANQ